MNGILLSGDVRGSESDEQMWAEGQQNIRKLIRHGRRLALPFHHWIVFRE